MQQISLNLTVPIPEGYVMIQKCEFEELQKSNVRGVYWSMQHLEQHINKKQDWIKENILYVPKFKQELDSALGGFVFYPAKKGQPWSFHAQKMMQFLDDNFNSIHHYK